MSVGIDVGKLHIQAPGVRPQEGSAFPQRIVDVYQYRPYKHFILVGPSLQVGCLQLPAQDTLVVAVHESGIGEEHLGPIHMDPGLFFFNFGTTHQNRSQCENAAPFSEA